MKRIIYQIIAVAILVFTFSCCGNSPIDKKFNIELDIKGIKDGGVYCTAFGNRDSLDMSNIDTLKDGKLVINGTTTEAVMLRISFRHNDFLKKVDRGYIPTKSSSLWAIVYPGANFSIDADFTGKDFCDYYPTDGGENDILAKLNSQMMPLLNKYMNAYLETEVNKKLTKEEKDSLKNIMSDYSDKIDAVKKDFITNHTNSFAAIWLMEDMLMRSEIDYNYLLPLIKKVSSKYYDNEIYKTLKARLDGAVSTSVGQQCPDIQTDNTPDGKMFKLEQLKGKYVIIDFWGTWCGPCMAGVPHMKAFRDKYSSKLEILGISNDVRRIEAWKKAIIDNKMNWPNILIGSGDKDFVSKFNVQGFPTKIVLDPNGKIIHRETGEREEFYGIVESLMKP